jgi:uncharacterized protein
MTILARVFMLALLLAGAAQAEVAVPALSARVTDLTSTLSSQQIQTLESRLAAFEARKGAQIAVLLLPTTRPETIEQYSIRVAESWRLGRKGVDDGVLLLVAKEDRAMRIEVGYGLEGALNDATAKRIVAEIITPFFKRDEFYQGLDAGTAAIIQVVEGEPLPEPQTAPELQGKEIELLLIVAVGVSMVVGGLLRALLGRFPAALLTGGGLGLVAWLTVAPLLSALLVGAMAFVFVLLGGMRHGYGGHRGGHGGFGGGFGGGGFGGGGGGFGGGGASGRW